MARSVDKPKISVQLPDLEFGRGQASWPLQSDHVETWAWAENVFTPEECEAIINMGEKLGLEKARVGRLHLETKIRNSNVCFIYPNGYTSWIFEKMTATANFMNENYFRFDIQNFGEGLQITRYSSDRQHYDFHVDRSYGSITRKLSMSVMLSDPSTYKGGDFEIKEGSKPIKLPKKQGTVLAFPSYVLHRVRPVTHGVRYSLVAWIGGPCFR